MAIVRRVLDRFFKKQDPEEVVLPKPRQEDDLEHGAWMHGVDAVYEG